MQEVDLVRRVCGAYCGYETAEVCGARRVGGGAGCVGGRNKIRRMGCFLDDPRAFGINADHYWRTAAQN